MNKDLKEKTPFNTKISFLITLIILILMCLFIPTIDRKPYTPRVDAAIRAIDLPPQLQQLKEPPPPPKPQMPVAAESEEEIEATTIERTDFDGFERSPQLATEIHDFYRVEVRPKLLTQYCVYPAYPDIVRRMEIEGTVMLELVLDTEGRVEDIKVVQSLYPLLDAEAVKAVRQWRYTPAYQRDRPVKVRLHQPVRFSLSGSN